MSKDKGKNNDQYQSELLQQHSNRKNLYNQVNGETQANQTDQKTKLHKKRGG